MNPGLGLIANLGVGTNNIDLEAAADRGIAVSNTPVVTEDTADLTLAPVGMAGMFARRGEVQGARAAADTGAILD